MGQAMFTIIAVMAQLERNIIQERITAGLAHAKEKGTKSGKDIGRPRRVFDRQRALELVCFALGTACGLYALYLWVSGMLS
jgi:DNA invertase Pin-like site-specific DNA recombinase